MMKSLRGQLLVGLTVSTALVLTASGIFIYFQISGLMRREFDDALTSRVRALATLAEQTEEGLEFEPVESAISNGAAAESVDYYQIWRPDGSTLARSDSLQEVNLDRITGALDTPMFADIQLANGRLARTVSITFVPRQEIESYDSTEPMNVTIALARETTHLIGTLARVRHLLIGVCVAAIVVSGGVLTRQVGNRLKPVDQLSESISGLRAEDLSVRVSAERMPSELVPVVARLNELLVRLQSAFEHERRFTSDVAHELRTPLAGLRIKMEHALSRAREPEVYRQTLRDCRQINLHMQRIVENLLQLARADAGQLKVNRETLDVGHLLRNCWERVSERAATRRLDIAWKLADGSKVHADGDKLRMVVGNVFDNVVAYTNDHGRVNIATATQNGMVTISVSNSGCTIADDQVQRVFDRLWRGDQSFQENGEFHCGLGLPLARALVEEMNGTIDAQVDSSGEFAVLVSLPRG